jgi:formate hydrogenlyase subunit 3/multisubunit Na+/H+ antiporter MnhD subunit
MKAFGRYARFLEAFLVVRFRVAFLAVLFLRVEVFFRAPADFRAPLRAEDFLVAFLVAFFVLFFLVAIVILQYWSVAADRSPGGPAAVWACSMEHAALLTRPPRGS